MAILCIPAEPTWTFETSKGVHRRPLLGSETVADSAHVHGDGCFEVCVGTSFETSLSTDALIPLVGEALGRLRFYAPLLGASVESDEGTPPKRFWLYKPAKDSSEINDWVKQTLTIHHAAPSVDEFIRSTAGTRVPCENGFSPSVFACHLLIHSNGLYSLMFHASHALMDGRPSVDAMRCMFRSISAPESEIAVKDLAWGEEWKNLPAGPITSCGGRLPGCDVEVPRLLNDVKEALASKKASVGLFPQRTEIGRVGAASRAHRFFDAETFKKIKAELSKRHLTVTVLLEAANILTTFAINAAAKSLDDDAHMTFDLQLIDLKKYFVPPHNTDIHLASSLGFVPLDIKYSDVPHHLSQGEQLVAVMELLKAQYAHFLSSDHVPHLGTTWQTPAVPNPHSQYITNLGVMERLLPLEWPLDKKEDPVLTVRDFGIGLRMGLAQNTVLHVWTIRSELHLQLSASDVYDDSYLEDLLDKIVKTVLTLVQP